MCFSFSPPFLDFVRAPHSPSPFSRTFNQVRFSLLHMPKWVFFYIRFRVNNACSAPLPFSFPRTGLIKSSSFFLNKLTPNPPPPISVLSTRLFPPHPKLRFSFLSLLLLFLQIKSSLSLPQFFLSSLRPSALPTRFFFLPHQTAYQLPSIHSAPFLFSGYEDFLFFPDMIRPPLFCRPSSLFREGSLCHCLSEVELACIPSFH